jgi:ATP-binding cassette subfamily B (MDR/TAP) protein 1
VSNLSDAPQKINGLAGITLAAYVAVLPKLSLSRLTFVFSIIQALATLIAGFTVGLIFIWKLGLVGFGKSSMLVSLLDLVLIAWHSMCSFPHVRWLHPPC